MSRLTTTSCVLVTMVALGVVYSAQAPTIGCSRARAIAQKLVDQLDQAYANHELNQVLAFFDPSFVLTDERGKRTAYPEWRRQWEQDFPEFRNMNPSTNVEDVQLEPSRMVVNYKTETHYEFHDQRNGWEPQIYKATGEDTWEKKGSQWILVRETVFRATTQVDPKWVETYTNIINNHYKAAQKVAESMGCPCR